MEVNILKEKEKRTSIDIFEYRVEIKDYTGVIFEYSLRFENGKYKSINRLSLNDEEINVMTCALWRREHLLLFKIIYEKISEIEQFFENKKKMKALRS